MIRQPKPQIVSLPLASLVEDMSIYPRHAVDDVHVRNLFLALESGNQLPPITACKKTKRITDGWHRARAYKRKLGPEAVVDVELIQYKTEADLLFDAVQRNASHGRKLDQIDQVRAVTMLESAGVTQDKISLALHVPEKRVEKLRIKIGKVKKSSSQAVPGSNKIVLKRPVQHLVGTTLTEEQAEVHKSLPGTSFKLVADQLSSAIRANMVDLGDENLMESFRELYEQLSRVLVD